MQVELTNREIELIMEAVEKYTNYLLEGDMYIYTGDCSILNNIYWKFRKINESI